VSGRLQVGILGTGWIADFHARAANEHPRCDLTVVGNWRPESLAAFAERHGIPRTTTDWRDVATDPELDAVVVATPNALHAPQAIACLEAGKHVLVEKPMARTAAEGLEMLAAARRSGRCMMIAHCWRFHDDVRALRERLVAGELGQVVRTRGYGIHAGWGPSGWFTDPELAGGGALIDMGVHAVDTARYLLGDPQPVHVAAVVGNPHRGGGVEDDAVLLIEWDSGAASVVEAGWWQPYLPGLEADTEVFGTAGYARIWDFTKGPEGYEHCAQPMYSAQFAAFADGCLDGAAPRPDGEDGLVVMRIVDEAYRSGRR
jgi:predicted dehydrogenase